MNKREEERLRKAEERLEKERARTKTLSVYEEEYKEYRYICGIDEVGRGPLAGPVVAGAVILPKDNPILYLNDSKKLSEKKREALYDEIMEHAVAVGIGMAGPARIDEINILQATYEAMRKAIDNLDVKPDLLLNDAVTIPQVDIKQVPIIKGDAKSVSIAAASIVAKVTRDRLMKEYDKVLPGYDFASNKGYGTKEHIAGLRELGPTPIHRVTFIKNYMNHNRKETGSWGERLAERFLEQSGYEILERNYRCKKGEIDLIARDGDYLVFCEVKYRHGTKSGGALEAVDLCKQKAVSGCAMYYLMEHKITDTACRFDVIGIEDQADSAGEAAPENVRISLVKDAFDYAG